MNKVWRKAAVLAVLLGGALPVQAADGNGLFKSYGIGALSCGDVTARSEEANFVPFLQSWVSGFITSRNRYRAETFDVTPVQDHAVLTRVALAVCEQNTEVQFVDTLIFIETTLARFAAPAAGDTLTLTRSGQSILFPAGSIPALQRALRELELYRGSIDGIFGPGSAAGLERFQRDRGFDVTGLPDVVTLYAIGRSLNE